MAEPKCHECGVSSNIIYNNNDNDKIEKGKFLANMIIG